MADKTAISDVARRYASALFELAASHDALDQVETDLGRFEALLAESDDLRRLVRSPVFSAEAQLQAVSAVVDRAGISGMAGNFIKVVAKNRRLFAVPDMIRAFRIMLADHRGETSAQVRVAHDLSDAQREQLTAMLREIVGRDVALDVRREPELLGGMIVKIGSRQIDTSLRTRLNNLKLALKAG